MTINAKLKIQEFLQVNHSRSFSTDYVSRYLDLPLAAVDEACLALIAEGSVTRPEYTDYVRGVPVDWGAVHEGKAARPAWSEKVKP